MASASATGSADALANPIPITAQATSHVDQLGTSSPPHPIGAFSVVDESPLPLLDNSTDSQQHSHKLHTKPHPADLVCIENPDPHASPPCSPVDSDQHEALPFGEESTASFSRVGDGNSTPSRRAQVSSILTTSENNVTVGHGSEEGPAVDSPRVNGHARRRSGSQPLFELDAEDHEGGDGEGDEEGDQVEALAPFAAAAPPAPPLPHSSSEPSSADDTPTDLKSSAAATPRKSHARSQSMASPSSSRPSSSGSRQPQPASASDARPVHDSERDRERRGERRDRERERDQQQSSSGGKEREKEKESSRSRRVLGEWTMSKTLGAGSMGKVKLGISSVTGEKVRSLHFGIAELAADSRSASAKPGRHQNYPSIHLDRCGQSTACAFKG